MFIGVIVNGMDEARQEMADAERASHTAANGQPSSADDVATLRALLAAMQDGLLALERRLKRRE